MKVLNAENYWEVISESAVPSSTRKIARYKTAFILHIVSMFKMGNWKKLSRPVQGDKNLTVHVDVPEFSCKNIKKTHSSFEDDKSDIIP